MVIIMVILIIMTIVIIAFDRTHTVSLVFRSRGSYDVPRVLLAGTRSFQALTAVLD